MIGGMLEWWRLPKGDLSFKSEPEPVRSPRVFISYSHQDSSLAQRLKEKLIAAGILVVIDSESLKPGDDIKKFIDESVRLTDVTVSIVSAASLLSAWVALESVTAIYQHKRLIGCFIDDSFLRADFVDRVIDHAESEGRQIGQKIKARIDSGRRFQDLVPKMDRYRELETRAPEIVGRFRDTACIDLREEAFEDGLQRLIHALKAKP